jgi:CRP/FNR family transcriptional regulator, cyclic AMP receptor protein
MCAVSSIPHPDPDRLALVSLFSGLSVNDRTRLASWMEVEDFDAGRRLTEEGAFDYAFFVLEQGRVRVEQGGTTIASLGPGDVFGEMAFFGDGRRNADLVAETAGRVLVMFGTRFREMQASMPEVAVQLQGLVVNRR